MQHTEKYLIELIEKYALSFQRVSEIIAAMKSNVGSHAQWIAELEEAIK
jgi:hypothetical protein